MTTKNKEIKYTKFHVTCLWCGRLDIAKIRYDMEADLEVELICHCDCGKATRFIKKQGQKPILKKAKD